MRTALRPGARLRLARWLAALALLGAATVAILLALDVRAWQHGLERGDRAYGKHPTAAAWTAATIFPGDPAGSWLAVADDLSIRDALRRYAVARATPKGYDNGATQARVRARAEVALSDVGASGSPQQASQADTLLGALVVDAVAPGSGGPAAGEERARAAWDAAVRADPANRLAKFDLELLLLRQRAIGTREGTSSGAGARGASKRGAGAGTPGKGY